MVHRWRSRDGIRPPFLQPAPLQSGVAVLQRPVGDPTRKVIRQMAAHPVDLAAVQELTHARGHEMFAGKLEESALSRPRRAARVLCRGLEVHTSISDRRRAATPHRIHTLLPHGP
jgi:hypothetical protein